VTGEFSFVKCAQPWLDVPAVKCIFYDVFSMCLKHVSVLSEKFSLWLICALMPPSLVLILLWLVPRGAEGILQRQPYVIPPASQKKKRNVPF